jgi:hypothetical protein
MAQLGAHGPLDQSLLEGHGGRVHRLPVMGPMMNWSISSLGIFGSAAPGGNGCVLQLRSAWHK